MLLVGTGDAGYADASRGNEAADGLAGAWFCAPNDHHCGRCQPPRVCGAEPTALRWPFCSIASPRRSEHSKTCACASAWSSSEKGLRAVAGFSKKRFSPESVAARLASFFLATARTYFKALTVAQQAKANAARSEAEAARPGEG
jgi:hypothetical protein